MQIYEYILFIITFLTIIVFITIRFYYSFWSHQPVYHTYDFIRGWTLPTNGTVLEHAPQKRKFCDFFHVKTRKYWEITDSEKREIVLFLQANYISSERVIHMISADALDHKMAGFKVSPTVSIHFDYDYSRATDTDTPTNTPTNTPTLTPPPNDSTGVNGGGDPDPDKETNPYTQVIQELQRIRKTPSIRGLMLTTRIYLYDDSTIPPTLPTTIYYWDYICTKRFSDETRVQQLIQTNDYNNRLLDNRGALFKKEVILCEGIVPLIQYQSYSYIIAPRFQLRPLPIFLTVQQIRSKDIRIVYQCMKTSGKKYILSEINNLISLMDHSELFVFSLKYRNEIYGIYFVKNTNMHYDGIEGGDVGSVGNTIQLVTSVKQVYSDELFVLGWEHVLHAVLKIRNTYRVLLIDEISDNHVILSSLNRRLAFQSNVAAYYLYNYGIYGMPFEPKDWAVIV